MVTILDLLREMQVWFTFEQSTINAAISSKINSKNNTEFGDLCEDWAQGRYDEDPGAVKSEILQLLFNEI